MSTDSVFERRTPIKRPRWHKLLPWVIGVCALALVIGYVALRDSNSGTAAATSTDSRPADDRSKVPPTVKIPQSAITVGRLFIQTAVARKNLDKAYGIVTDQIRQGQSLKSWRTGNIAVIPYPVASIKYAPIKVDFSYPKELQIEVALLPKSGSKARSQLFIMDLVKQGQKWLVNAWTPGTKPPVPNPTGAG